MKRKKPYLLAGLVLLLFLLCTACGNTEGQIAPQDDPNEGLGGGLSEDTVNDFSGFEGIWLGEADNDYDSMEFDAEGNWTLYLSGEVMDDGYLRYEPEWEAIYAYSSSDDSGSLIAMEDGQLYCAAYGYFNPGEGMEYLWYEDGGRLTEDDAPDSEDEVSDWNGRLDGDANSYWSWDSDLCQRTFQNSRASGTMTAISRLRPISSSTAKATGAFTSAHPALKARKWTAEFSPIRWMRRAPITRTPRCTMACLTRSLSLTRTLWSGAMRAFTT